MSNHTNFAYWMAQHEACLAIAKEVEGPNKYTAPTAVRPLLKTYRTAASLWRKAAHFSVSDDPASLLMVDEIAKDAAELHALADRKRADRDGTAAPAAPTAYPAAAPDVPEMVGIETARKGLGPLVHRVQHGGAEIVLTRNGTPAAMLVPIPAPLTGRQFMGQLAAELAWYQPRMFWDEDNDSPHLVVPVGPDAWVYIIRDPYGLVSVQKSADAIGSMVGGLYAHSLRTVAEVVEAVRRVRAET